MSRESPKSVRLNASFPRCVPGTENTDGASQGLTRWRCQPVAIPIAWPHDLLRQQCPAAVFSWPFVHFLDTDTALIYGNPGFSYLHEEFSGEAHPNLGFLVVMAGCIDDHRKHWNSLTVLSYTLSGLGLGKAARKHSQAFSLISLLHN